MCGSALECGEGLVLLQALGDVLGTIITNLVVAHTA